MDNTYFKSEESIEKWEMARMKSHATQRKQKQMRIDAYNTTPKICECCKTTIPYEKRQNKYCSSSCAAKVNNANKVIILKDYGTCFCGKKFKRGNIKYCSSKCQRNQEWDKMKQEIINTGNGNPKGRVENSPQIKRFIKETRGCVCEICRLSEWMGKEIPLILDHIDGHSENNKLTNLRLVCGNCDMQLPTYKSKNKGNGRARRRQRYKDGKSY